jgi:hypothetical protein
MRLLVPVLVTCAVCAAVLGAGLAIQHVALREPAPEARVALSAAQWLQRYRLVESSVRLDGATTTLSGRCVQAWFHGKRGALLRLSDGFRLLAVPPHTLEASGGTNGEDELSPLVLLELGGCPRLLGRRLATLAQQHHGLVLAGNRLRLSLKGTRLVLALAPSTHRPVAIRVEGRGRSEIRLRPLTPAVLRLALG